MAVYIRGLCEVPHIIPRLQGLNVVRTRPDMTNMIPVTYSYARVSKSDRDDLNLETQLRELASYGIRQDLIFSDVMTGRLMSRPGWDELMARVQPNDTIVVVWLDHFSRNFDEGVRIQADLTKRNIGIVAIREGIDTTDDSAAAKYFRRMMMANDATGPIPPASA